MSSTDEPGTYEEWRVTGDPGDGYRPYVCTWGPSDCEDPELSARGFVSLIRSASSWPVGPHLHHRTVTLTAWEEVE